MEPRETDDKSKAPATEAPGNYDLTGSRPSIHKSFFAQQVSTADGGVPTDLYCPGCREEIRGSYLPIFMCPFCEIQIWRDDKGNVTNYEQKHTCPECGHAFGELTDDAPSEFQRMVRNFGQKTEGMFLGLDRVVTRMLT